MLMELDFNLVEFSENYEFAASLPQVTRSGFLEHIPMPTPFRCV